MVSILITGPPSIKTPATGLKRPFAEGAAMTVWLFLGRGPPTIWESLKRVRAYAVVIMSAHHRRALYNPQAGARLFNDRKDAFPERSLLWESLMSLHCALQRGKQFMKFSGELKIGCVIARNTVVLPGEARVSLSQTLKRPY